MNAIGLATPPVHATTARTGAPACLLVNPRSHSVRNSRLRERAIALASRHGAEIIEADTPARISAGLDRALAHGARRLFVLSGDGTVQALTDCLAGLPAGLALPQLMLLAGGRTNLTAADLDGQGDVLKKLESALIRATGDPVAGFRVQQRRMLVIEQPPAPPRHGFFVAAAVVDALIRHCNRYRAAGSIRLRTSGFGTTWCLLKAAVPAMRGREPFASPELELDLPGVGRLRGPMRILIATTLIHGGQRFNPYAERGEGALRLTAVRAGARGFWRSLPRLITGRLTPAMDIDRGYLSGRSGHCAVRGLEGYSLDGQSFSTDPARPVVIRAGAPVDFLLP